MSVLTPPVATSPRPGRSPVVAGRSPAYRLTWAAVAITAPMAAATALLDGLLHGPAAMNGSARGTALVMFLVAPVVAGAAAAARRGSARAVPLWIGGLAYLLYNATMLLFATPFNELFLAYVATFSLAGWALVTVVHGLDLAAFDARFAPGPPARTLAVYTWVVVALNTAMWLRGILPGMAEAQAPAFLEGTGLTTNPVYVQDLAVWLPLAAVAAWWLWNGRPAGRLVVPSMLVLWVIESIGIAVDQWWGHLADPASPVASAAVVPVFAVLALVGLVPVVACLRRLDRHPHRPADPS